MRIMIPNIVSLLRLIGIPVLLFFMAIRAELPWWSTSMFFLLLAVTDVVDGWLARKLDAETDFGALLDPLIDKLLILCPLITLVGMRSVETNYVIVPAWMVVLLLARELWITGLRGLAATRGVVIQAAELGKLKTLLQVIAVTFLLIEDITLFEWSRQQITAQYIGLQSLLGAIIVAYISGLEYTMQFFRVVSNSAPVQPTQKGRKSSSFLLGRRA